VFIDERRHRGGEAIGQLTRRARRTEADPDPDAEEVLVQAGVAGEFRVEGGGEQIALRAATIVILEGGNGAGEVTTSSMRARMNTAWNGRLKIPMMSKSASKLSTAAEGVATDTDVHHFDARAVEVVDLLREEDGARAGAPDRPAAGAEVAEGLLETVGEDEAGNRGAFAAGNDEGVQVAEVFGFANLVGEVAQPTEHLAVLAEVALEGEYANGAWTRVRLSHGLDVLRRWIRRNKGIRELYHASGVRMRLHRRQHPLRAGS
jgi:hypothetical protein